jgi:osmotically-inducible protein OsmY
MKLTLRFRAAALAALIALGAAPSWGVGGAHVEMDAVTAEPGSADRVLADRVLAALQAAPYFYAGHVDVSVRDGNVVLTGFVFNDWDLRDALRIAAEAAKPHRVIDGLDIKEGGRR